MTGRELAVMEIPDACKAKWEEGLREYGRSPDEPFQGEPPIYELVGELVDGMNYCDEAERDGYDVAGIRNLVLVALVLTRLVASDHEVER